MNTNTEINKIVTTNSSATNTEGKEMTTENLTNSTQSNKETAAAAVILPAKQYEHITIEKPAMIMKARIYMKPSAEAVEYARLIAPKQLVGIILKPALWRSLKTSDKAEALEAAAAVAIAFHELMQEIATENLINNTPMVELSTEIQAENFLELIEKVDREVVEVIKADLKEAFFKAPKTGKTPRAERKVTTKESGDPATSKRLQSFKRKRKQRQKGARTNNRHN